MNAQPQHLGPDATGDRTDVAPKRHVGWIVAGSLATVSSLGYSSSLPRSSSRRNVMSPADFCWGSPSAGRCWPRSPNGSLTNRSVGPSRPRPSWG